MRLLILLFVLLISFPGVAQVRDVKSKVEKDKSLKTDRCYDTEGSGRSTTYWDSPDLEDGLAAFIVGGLVYYTGYSVYMAADYGQKQMQYRRHDHPETFSFEAGLKGGFDYYSSSFVLSPSLRINRGIFASDLRYQCTTDVTGNLQVLDWQVLKLRLPLSNLKLEYGVGFSRVFDPSKTYFEQSVAADWCFFQRKVTLQGQYRWSQKTNIGARYRKEAEIFADYEMSRINRLRICPGIGFGYQNYFGSSSFRFVQIGLKVRFF